MKLSLSVLVASASLVLAQSPLPRMALVMGVGDYGGAKFKGGAINDLPGITTADLPGMEAKLEALGFNVTVVADPTLGQAKDAVDAFSARIKANPGVSLFYFSGHGGEYEGKNYLIPRGANIGSKADLADEALNAQRVLNGMEESGAPVNLVFLDCCREDLGKSVGGAELAPLKAKGSFIGFATRSGDFADAGEEGSVYTRFLLKHLDKPGLSVADMYSLVIGEVKDFSKRMLGEERRPGFYSELDAPFYLAPVKPIPGSPPATLAMNEAEVRRRARELAAKMAADAAIKDTADTQLTASTKSFINSLGMKFVPVPGTQVLMCIHETRNVDYAAYAAAQSGVDDAWQGDAEAGKEQHPVVRVSHGDAEGFCRWLGEKEGRAYRLPTDAEWSAAVGGKEYPWGDEFPPEPHDGNYGTDLVDDGFKGTAPVMSFRANKLGIYDLGGSVWEWCGTWYSVEMDDGKALEGFPELKEKPVKVLRGASYGDETRASMRSLNRAAQPAGFNFVSNFGFRIVLVP